MVMLTKKTVILAKSEVTYGTDPTPASGDDAIEAYDVNVEISPEMKERNPGNSDLSMFPEARGKTMVNVSFSTYLKGSGSVALPPRLAPLFKACFTDETINSGTSVEYAPASSSPGSCTIYAYLDGILHSITGCVGNVEIDLTAGEFGIATWTFQGLYAIPTDQAIVDPTFDSPDPEVVKGCTMTIGSYSAIIEKLTLNLNNVIANRPDYNQTEGYKGFAVTGRNPEGTMTVEAVLRATSNADFVDYFHNRTVKALSFALGATAGNILTITADKTYNRAPKWVDREGVRVYEIPFQIARDSGNDEIVFTFS